MLTGKEHHGSPPGFVTATEAAKRLGMHRQSFYRSGLAESLERWATGNMTLYRIEDIDRMRYWLTVRQALIDAGKKPANAPLRPTPAEWHQAVYEDRWSEVVVTSGC